MPTPSLLAAYRRFRAGGNRAIDSLRWARRPAGPREATRYPDSRWSATDDFGGMARSWSTGSVR